MSLGKLQVFVFRHTEFDAYRIRVAHGGQHGLPGRYEVADRQIAGTDPAGERSLYFRIAHVDPGIFQNRFVSRYLSLSGIPLGNGKIILLFGNCILFI